MSSGVGAAWELGPALTDAHHERLTELGVKHQLLERLGLREVTGHLPAWWRERGNTLYVTPDLPFLAARLSDLAAREVSDALVVLASPVENATCTRLHGDGATLFIGPGCTLPEAEVHCHGGSAIVLVSRVTCTSRGSLDARNGGRILARADQLWASDVILATDDMHRLEDAETGQRINGFGGVITIGRHVWLGRDAVLTGDVTIGKDSVVGMRSVVRNRDFGPGTAIAGTPARAIRTGVTWTREDTP